MVSNLGSDQALGDFDVDIKKQVQTRNPFLFLKRRGKRRAENRVRERVNRNCRLHHINPRKIENSTGENWDVLL